MPYAKWEIDGDLLKGEIQGDMLIGFPAITGNLDSIGDWNINFENPCINELNYEIIEIEARGAVTAVNLNSDGSR